MSAEEGREVEVHLVVNEYATTQERLAWLEQIEQWIEANTKSAVRLSVSEVNPRNGRKYVRGFCSYNNSHAYPVARAILEFNKHVPQTGDDLYVGFDDPREATLFKLTLG